MRWAAFLALLMLVSFPANARSTEPADYLFAGGTEVAELADILSRPDIGGIQVVYSWRSLEPRMGEYDFSRIDADLAQAERLDRRLWVQLQDRFFSPEARLLPDYILTDALYDGGLARQVDRPGEGQPIETGWVARQWNPALRSRFQLLIQALARKFDGRIEGINLPETAADISDEDSSSFDCDAYFAAELDNIRAARRAFRTSEVVQYVNFWPCEWDNDHRYMERMFEAAIKDGFGLGGPDIVPWRKGQMKNSYPFFRRHHGQLPIVAMAVQEPTLTYADPTTGAPFMRETISAFARDYLGVGIIFWSVEAAWLSGASRPAHSADKQTAQ